MGRIFNFWDLCLMLTTIQQKSAKKKQSSRAALTSSKQRLKSEKRQKQWVLVSFFGSPENYILLSPFFLLLLQFFRYRIVFDIILFLRCVRNFTQTTFFMFVLVFAQLWEKHGKSVFLYFRYLFYKVFTYGHVCFCSHTRISTQQIYLAKRIHIKDIICTVCGETP